MLSKLIKPTLSGRDIIVHVDQYQNNELQDDAYKNVSNNGGFEYPLVKIRNTFIDSINIKHFELNVGNNFFPTLTIIISDNERTFVDLDFPIRDELLTIRIANIRDTIHEPIHLDFDILTVEPTGVMSNKTSLTITARLHIPNINNSKCISLGRVSGLEALKSVCSDLSLGLVTNITTSNDVQYWTQQHSTNREFLNEIIDHIYVNEDTFIHSFIDQYGNVNLIDLNKAFTIDKTPTFINYDLLSGNPLKNGRIEVKYTNNILSGEDDETSMFHIEAWQPQNKSGLIKDVRGSLINHNLQTKDYSIQDGKFNESVKDEIVESALGITVSGDNVDVSASSTEDRNIQTLGNTYIIDNEHKHKYYDITETHNKMGVSNFLNKMSLDIRISNVNNLLYMFMPINIELNNQVTNHSPYLRDTDEGNITDNKSAVPNRFNQYKNLMFSGWYLVTGLTWRYINKDNARMKQVVNITKREYNKQHNELNK